MGFLKKIIGKIKGDDYDDYDDDYDDYEDDDYSGCSEKDLKFFLKKAKKGDVDAQNLLAKTYYEDERYEQAVYWWSKAAAQGSIEANRGLYEYYEDEGDESSIRYLRKAAELGDKESQFELAELYEEDRKYNEAIKWYEKAGNYDRANKLRNRMNKRVQESSTSNSTTKNYNISDLISRSNNGDTYAMCQLAKLYSEGTGVEKNINKAIDLYRKAGATNKVKELQDLKNANKEVYREINSYIFISYSHQDKDIVMPFIKELEKKFNIWYDKEGIKMGASDWRNSIMSNIEKCAFVLFFVSNNTLKSEPCINERFHIEETYKKDYQNIILHENLKETKEFLWRNKMKQNFMLFDYSNNYSMAVKDLEKKCGLFKKYSKIKKQSY